MEPGHVLVRKQHHSTGTPPIRFNRRPGPRIRKFCPFLKLTSPEQDLVLKASQGDEVAFSKFVQRKKKWLFRKVRPYVVNDEDAFDPVQDILLAHWRNLGRYDPKYSPANGWVLLHSTSVATERDERWLGVKR